jgi:predicted metalloprotease
MTKIRSTDASGIDDRRGQSGGGGGFSLPGLGGGGFPFPIKAGGGVLGLLVVLAATLLPRLLQAGGVTTGTGVGSSSRPSSSAGSATSSGATCSSELEQIVCGAEQDVQRFWAGALPKFYNTPYEAAPTTFFSDRTSTGCGAASSSAGPFYCPADRHVYIDLPFMQDLEQRFVGTTSDLAEQYIVAHEYGHHVQDLLGISAAVDKASQRQPSKANQYSVALELQADCYAGVWVHDVDARGLLDSTNEVDEALAAASGVGDDHIQQQEQGRVDPDTFTHGTSEQRRTWFSTGFRTGDPRQCTSIDEVL